MARMDDDEIDQIIQQEKPGFRVIKRGASRRRAESAEAEGPGLSGAAGAADEAEMAGLELDELRRRYLGDDAPILGDAIDADRGDEGDEIEDEVVIVEPDQRPGFETAPGAKTVIISGKDRRIIAEQG